MDIIQIINDIDAVVWGVPMIVVLLGSHLYLTIRTRFIQRKLGTAIKLSVTKDPDAPGDISQFGALATALSATIGTGNIVGVGTAVLAGGPGAVFWMWLTGVFGIATKYAETYAAVKFRVRDHNGNMLGGAMYAWRRAYERKDGSCPWWAMLGAGAFALFAAVAALGTGSAVQSNAMVNIIQATVPDVPSWLLGAIVVVLVALVVFGSVQLIARVCEKLVPIMAFLYLVGCIVILAMNGQYIIPALETIVRCAFTGEAVFGGAIGSGLMVALQFGCARGLFSNESGLGSASIVAAAASTRNPARQALVAMTGTFWSTVIICAITGVVLVSTMMAHPDIVTSGTLVEGVDLTTAAFSAIPVVGMPVLVVGMVTFAYSTILGWSYYGSRCVSYLLGKHAGRPYQVLYVLMAFLGAVGVGNVAWTIADIGNALMALPNIIVVLLLSGLIARETKHYVWDGNLDEHSNDEIPTVESK